MIGVIAGLNIPISGLTLIGVAAIVGGVVVIVFARAMPAVTMPGAMIRAMLAAYRRTLQKTMAQARSMQQVVDEAGLAWLDTPDQAVVWGTALGLQSEIEGVLSRSLEDVQAGQTSGIVPYFPFWYQTSSGTPFMGSAGAGGSGGSLFSDSAIPDVGGMMSALGTIGNSPVVVGRQRRRRLLPAGRRAAGAAAPGGGFSRSGPARRRPRTHPQHASRPSIVSGGLGRACQSSASVAACLARTPSGREASEPVLRVAQ